MCTNSRPTCISWSRLIKMRAEKNYISPERLFSECNCNPTQLSTSERKVTDRKRFSFSLISLWRVFPITGRFADKPVRWKDMSLTGHFADKTFRWQLARWMHLSTLFAILSSCQRTGCHQQTGLSAKRPRSVFPNKHRARTCLSVTSLSSWT